MDVDFEKLIELQRLDAEIKKVQSLLDSIPSQVEAIDRQVESSAQTLSQARDKLAHNQKRRRELEAEVKDIKSQVSKYKLQLNQVKTNREYQSLLKEIGDNQQKIDKLEEEIIGELLQADEIEVDIRAAVEKDNQEKAVLHQEKETLALEKSRLEEELQRLIKSKQALLPLVPKDQAVLYLRIFDKKGGIALSPVTDDFCMLCHVRVRPQMLSELVEKNQLLLCENCGRILYRLKEKPEPEEDASSAK
ncbi:MAG TPA: C4-type zinc ribbon domain-containing protein [Acidobacteriota bacterium]